MYNSIQPLPKELSNQIKSQVDINSLSSCICEVIKNSVDAKATNISISLDVKRLSFRVVDNGEGITPQDLELIGKSGNTSRFHSGFSKIDGIYGFRGESLSSVCAQSIITITSRHKNYNCAKSVRINFGERSKTYITAESISPSGTSILCDGLFSNYPVRHKQVVSVPESSHIEHLKHSILPIAVGHPHISISVYGTNHKRLFFVSEDTKNSSLSRHMELLKSMHGLRISKSWDCIEAHTRNSSVKATIAHDKASSKSCQHIVINGQKLREIALYNEIGKYFSQGGFGCSELNSGERYPIYIIDIKYPISWKDYILDPTRCIYSTEDYDYILKLLLTMCGKFLQLHNYKRPDEACSLNPEIKKASVSNEYTPNSTEKHAVLLSKTRMAFQNPLENAGRVSIGFNNSKSKVRDKSTQRISIQQSTFKTSFPNYKKKLPKLNTRAASSDQWGLAFSRFFIKPTSNVILDHKIPKSSLKSCRVISQVGNKFILIVCYSSTGQHLLIIDQHAADERIKLEHYLNVFTSKDLQETTTRMEKPMVLDLSDIEMDILRQYSPNFTQLGILYDMVKSNGKYHIEITHVPQIAHTKILAEKKYEVNRDFLRRMIVDHAHDIHEKRVSRFPVSHDVHWATSIRSYPAVLVDIYKSKACRSAIKFGDILDLKECERLVCDLSQCLFPFQCAHGRPSMTPLVDLSIDDHV